MVESNGILLGRIQATLDRADSDRREISGKLDGVNNRLDELNHRTRTLEDKTEGYKAVAEQVGKMADTFQIADSAINTIKNWGWKLALLFAITLIVGNQAATKIFDLLLKLASGPH